MCILFKDVSFNVTPPIKTNEAFNIFEKLVGKNYTAYY